MFTPKIVSVDKNGSQVKVLVNFNNGQNTVDDYFALSPNQTPIELRRAIYSRVNQLNSLYIIADSIPLGTVSSVTTVIPTQDELDENDFKQKYRKLLKIKEAIDVGVVNQNDTVYSSILSELQSKVNLNWI